MLPDNRADFRCCLSYSGSVNDPKCIVYEQRREIMARSWMRDEDKSVTCAGKSILEMMEIELDEVMERLMLNGGLPNDVGAAQGIATCLAIIKNPYYPNIDSIKAEAVIRWEVRQADALSLDSAGDEEEEEIGSVED